MSFAELETSKYKPMGMRMPQIRGRVAGVVRLYAELIESRIKASMASPKSGRLYTLPGGRVHQASAPGEPPAVLSAKLYASVKCKFYYDGTVAEVGVFGDGPPYSGELELGGGNVAPRPYVKPAFEAFEKPFVRAVGMAVGSIIGQVAQATKE